MTKPNTTFKLSIRDVEVIEQALRNKAGRRGMAIAQGDTSPELKAEMYEIQDVLGRIHEQKNFYAKFKDGQPYVSGQHMSMNPWQFVGFFKKKEKPKTPTRLEQMKKDKNKRVDSDKMTDIEKMDKGFNGNTYSINGKDVDF